MTKFSFVDIRLMQEIAKTGHTSTKVLHIHMIKYLYWHFRATKSSIYIHIRLIFYDHTKSVLLFGDELSIPTRVYMLPVDLLSDTTRGPLRGIDYEMS